MPALLFFYFLLMFQYLALTHSIELKKHDWYYNYGSRAPEIYMRKVIPHVLKLVQSAHRNGRQPHRAEDGI